MKVSAITVLAPQIHLINAGLLARLFRPAGGMLDTLQPGDLLWVREPFVLPAQFDHLAPTQAKMCGAKPLFAAGPVTGHLQPGRPRFARELLRVWHRQHLRIMATDRRPVQSITAAELADQGYALFANFAEAWDRNLSLTRSGRTRVARRHQSFSKNPEALVIDFERIAASVDVTLGEAA